MQITCIREIPGIWAVSDANRHEVGSAPPRGDVKQERMCFTGL